MVITTYYFYNLQGILTSESLTDATEYPLFLSVNYKLSVNFFVCMPSQIFNRVWEEFMLSISSNLFKEDCYCYISINISNAGSSHGVNVRYE